MDTVINLIGAAATLFAIYKIVVDVMLARSSKHREEYQFSKDYIKDLNDENVHEFSLEKGFRALTGKTYSVAEIKHLLNYPSPSEAINWRADSGKFLNFNADKNCYEWADRLQSEFKRNHIKKWYLSCYGVFAVLAIFPIYFKGIIVLGNVSVVAFCASTGVIAIGCLLSSIDYDSSRKLMRLENVPNKSN